MRSLYFLLLLGIVVSACSTDSKESPPNILVFLVDDMGWQDTSVPFHTENTPFNERYNTPAMEKLAAQGMIFTQAYSNSVCTPTRVSLLTGMNAARHRVTNWTLRKGGDQEPRHPYLNHRNWNVNGLSPEPGVTGTVYATPLPAILKNAGYHTIHVGKAHFGAMDTPGADPLNLGFEVNIGGHAAGAPGSYEGLDSFGNSRNNAWDVPGLEKYHGEDIYLTEALTREAIAALEENLRTGQSFFLYMSHYAVHTPIMADKRFVQKYLDAGLDQKEASYASMVEGMDKSLGDLMEWLGNNGLEDNTIILFTSDNGGLSAVARGGEKHTHNRPLSSGKGSAHEGGIREPMIVSWPGQRASGKIEQPVIIEDFFPTILEMAGIEQWETVQDIDGISFAGLLEGKKMDYSRPLFWHYPNFWGPSGPGIGPSSTIRKGDWKLIYYHDKRDFELFNLAKDIGETKNMYKEKAEIADSLARILGDYLRSVKADMPYDSSLNDNVPWPDQIQ